MRYADALKLIAAADHGGRRIRREAWPAGRFLHRLPEGGYSREVTPEDVRSEDWTAHPAAGFEPAKEPEKPKGKGR